VAQDAAVAVHFAERRGQGQGHRQQFGVDPRAWPRVDLPRARFVVVVVGVRLLPVAVHAFRVVVVVVERRRRGALPLLLLAVLLVPLRFDQLVLHLLFLLLHCLVSSSATATGAVRGSPREGLVFSAVALLLLFHLRQPPAAVLLVLVPAHVVGWAVLFTSPGVRFPV
jgi:hypothetical protein